MQNWDKMQSIDFHLLVQAGSNTTD
jgi:hypothetical protein